MENNLNAAQYSSRLQFVKMGFNFFIVNQNIESIFTLKSGDNYAVFIEDLLLQSLLDLMTKYRTRHLLEIFETSQNRVCLER